jgi:hypothetical protein
MLLKMDSTHITQLETFTGQKIHRRNGYLKNVKTLVEITSVFSLGEFICQRYCNFIVIKRIYFERQKYSRRSLLLEGVEKAHIIELAGFPCKKRLKRILLFSR